MSKKFIKIGKNDLKNSLKLVKISINSNDFYALLLTVTVLPTHTNIYQFYELLPNLPILQ